MSETTSRRPAWASWSNAEFARAITLAFAALLIAGLFCHEMWRDELQGWLMARHARGLSQLVRLAGREGHPACGMCFYFRWRAFFRSRWPCSFSRRLSPALACI